MILLSLQSSSRTVNCIKKSLFTGLIASALLITTSWKARAATIAGWTFETSQPTTAGNINPEIGSGALSVFHSSPNTFASPQGNGSAHCCLSSGWSNGDYYLIKNINTTGLSNLTLSFDMTGSNTGPKSFGLAFSTDGTNFITIPGINITVLLISWSSASATNSAYSFPLPPAIENNASVSFKIFMINNSTAVSGATIAAGGTNRIDNLMITTPAALPLYFNNFTLNKEGVQNKLKWTTSNESDLKHFIIESSANGKDFKEVSRIKPYNFATENEYTYTDMASPDKQFYRISGEGLNGALSHTKVIAVGAENLVDKGLQCNYNNASHSIQFMNNGNYFSMDYTIVNAAGVVVRQQYNKNLSAGINIVDASELSAGMYFVKCGYGGKMYFFKMVK